MASLAEELLNLAYGEGSVTTSDFLNERERMLAREAPRERFRPFPEPSIDTTGFSPFPSLSPLRAMPGAEARNYDPDRGRPKDAMAPVSEAVSPTMGAYGLGHLLTSMGREGYEGDWKGVADKLPLAMSIFAGVKAKTANLPALERAHGMAAKGAPREAIWNDTGWFQGKDGKWRWEIDDSGMKRVVPLPEWLSTNEKGERMAPNVSAAWDAANRNLTAEAPVRIKRLFEHPALARAYPHGFTKTPEHGDITGIPVMIQPNSASRGAYDPSTKTVLLNEALMPGDAKGSLIHELQHIVQRHEEHAPGGSPARFLDSKEAGNALQELYGRGRTQEERDAVHKALTADKDALGWGHALYKRLAGEVEARNATARMGMTAEQRRLSPPWETQDIPDIHQLFKKHD